VYSAFNNKFLWRECLWTVFDGCLWWLNYAFSALTAFCAFTLLVGRQEEHPACKNWVMRCWCGYLSGARCRLFAYGPADATASPNPSSPASLKSRLVLLFWYRPSQLVPEKRPWNGCSSCDGLITEWVSGEGCAVGHVRLSARLFPLNLLNSDLVFARVWVMTVYRRGLKGNVKGQCRNVCAARVSNTASYVVGFRCDVMSPEAIDQ